MFYLKNHTTFEEKKKNIVTEIKINKAEKKDRNKEWVYNDSDKENINIPHINIDDNEILKLNEKIKKEDDFISSDYLYSINENILSILFIKTYEDNIKYDAYNINLNNTKIISGTEALNNINKDIYEIKNNCFLSIEYELKKYHFDNETFENYYKKTIDEFNNSFYSDNAKIYIGNNKKVMVIIDIYKDDIKPIIINIVDK